VYDYRTGRGELFLDSIYETILSGLRKARPTKEKGNHEKGSQSIKGSYLS
jgi:hypothetical protein